MFDRVLEVRVQCPCCWESFLLLVDPSVEQQEYVEDCEICCQPIDFTIDIDADGSARVAARSQQA